MSSCYYTHPRARGITSICRGDLPTQQVGDSARDQCVFFVSLFVTCRVDFDHLIVFLPCLTGLTILNPHVQFQIFNTDLFSVVLSFSHSFLAWCVFSLNSRTNWHLLLLSQVRQPLFGTYCSLTVALNPVGFDLTSFLSFCQ